jgi:hypothetical protein
MTETERLNELIEQRERWKKEKEILEKELKRISRDISRADRLLIGALRQELNKKPISHD